MAIILLGHLLFFALFHDSILRLLRMLLPCAFALKNIKKCACSSLEEAPTPGILCNEHFMRIVSSLRICGGQKSLWVKKSLRYYYAFFTINSSKRWCWSLAVCFRIRALSSEGLAPKNYLSQAPLPTDFRAVPLMEGTGRWLRWWRKGEVRAVILSSFQMTSEAVLGFCRRFRLLLDT